jgi:hypothetical protein
VKTTSSRTPRKSSCSSGSILWKQAMTLRISLISCPSREMKAKTSTTGLWTVSRKWSTNMSKTPENQALILTQTRRTLPSIRLQRTIRVAARKIAVRMKGATKILSQNLHKSRRNRALIRMQIQPRQLRTRKSKTQGKES